MTEPNVGLASTFDQGAGVGRPGVNRMMYSRPSGLKPPMPLSSRSAGASASGALAAWLGAAVVARRAGRIGAGAGARFSCSARLPRSSSSTTRATACIRTRSGSGICSNTCTNTPPCRSSSAAGTISLICANGERCAPPPRPRPSLHQITRSTFNPFTHHQAWACSSWRASASVLASSTRSSTIGRSPEIAYGHRPDWPRLLPAMSSGAARSARCG